MICAYIQKISIPASYYELNKIKFSINWPSRHKQSILSVGSTAAIYRSAVNCATHTAPYMHNTSTQSSGICVLLLLLLHHSPSCSQRESPIVRTTQPYRIYIYIYEYDHSDGSHVRWDLLFQHTLEFSYVIRWWLHRAFCLLATCVCVFVLWHFLIYSNILIRQSESKGETSSALTRLHVIMLYRLVARCVFLRFVACREQQDFSTFSI